MSARNSDLIGRLAVHYQLIDAAQLAHAAREQDRQPDKSIGEILLELGFVNPTQLSQLVEAQRQYLSQDNVVRPAPPQPPAARAPAPPGPPQPPAARAPAPPPAAAPAPRPVLAQRVESPSAGVQLAAASSPQVKWLHQVLASAAKQGASDVHIHAGSRVKARKFGDLVDLTKETLSAQETEGILLPSLLDWQREQLLERGEVDFSYSVEHVGRYRVNVYKGQSGLAGVYHYIPATPPLITSLGLPEHAARLVNHQNGIVLITGPSGCGKTSTMAALVNLLNEEREDHILSIEDPIEYVHVSKRCVVNQRQIARHTKSFGAALRSALREDPDVICIGELRDLETISLALSAAETGHLVLGTLHTQGAVRTISRIIGAYPSRQQSQIRMMLSESLRAVISQKLLPRADGTGVVLAYELLFMNLAAANLIRENRTFQLGSVLQTGRSAGMRSMDDSLRELLQKGLITKRTAQLNADSPKSFV